MKILKKIIWTLLNGIQIGAFVQLAMSSSLREEGWFKSFYAKEAIDKNNNPIPWFTYSFLHFIQNRLNSEMSIFEYGSGNSTIWFSSKVKKIKSVENDLEWFNKVSAKLPVNCEIVFRPLDGTDTYSKSVNESKEKFDIIIIDGRDRVKSTKASIEALNTNGIIIFDNSQVEEYREALDYLEGLDFKRIDFVGILPIVAYNNTTSIFYRKYNCLGI
jgi:hypothetical protein